MIKMVASDLDGTLLIGGRQTLPEEIFPLVKELKKMGILFVAASGRQYANMRNLFAPVKDEMAFISENGGLLSRMRSFCTATALTKNWSERSFRQYGKSPERNFPVLQRIFIISCPRQNIIAI